MSGIGGLNRPDGRTSIFSLWMPIRISPSRHSLINSSGSTSRRSASQELAPDSVVYRRFFLSDAANQIEILKKSHLFSDPSGRIRAAVSVIQQPPVRSSKVAVLAYHIDSKKGMEKIPAGEHSLLVKRNGTSQLWFTNLQESEMTEEFARSSYRQTDFLFQSLLEQLSAHRATLKDNTIRTWVYVRDVDRNYKGMVDRRRELFTEQGLTSQTHFISSTGIEGCTASPHALVTMDALSLLGVQSRQIRFLHAPAKSVQHDPVQCDLRAGHDGFLSRPRPPVYLRYRQHR